MERKPKSPLQVEARPSKPNLRSDILLVRSEPVRPSSKNGPCTKQGGDHRRPSREAWSTATGNRTKIYVKKEKEMFIQELGLVAHT